MKQLTFGVTFLISGTLIFSCQKEEGPGGTSSITGHVTGQVFEPAETEITELIFSDGAEIEHGEYWILNTPVGGTYYYIWYDNPTWAPDGDPQLDGRTGIPVVYNYSDSNLEIADATVAAIEPVLSADFTLTQSNDVLLLTNKTAGYVPDANNMTSPFEFNIANQGKDAVFSEKTAVADERVYLVYGDNTSYGEMARTGGDGEFTFTSLTKGMYTVYVLSLDSLGGSAMIKKSTTVEIGDNKTTVDAGMFEILY